MAAAIAAATGIGEGAGASGQRPGGLFAQAASPRGTGTVEGLGDWAQEHAPASGAGTAADGVSGGPTIADVRSLIGMTPGRAG